MKKLQVKQKDGSWRWVFGRNKHTSPDPILTDTKSKALPPSALWADDDLKWAQSAWPRLKFRLAETLEAP